MRHQITSKEELKDLLAKIDRKRLYWESSNGEIFYESKVDCVQFASRATLEVDVIDGEWQWCNKTDNYKLYYDISAHEYAILMSKQ